MKTVLIADDAAFVRKSLMVIFEQNGFEIASEAGNGVEAVNKYQRLKPDLVTMDITMPEMNGIDAVQAIKEFDPNCNIIVVSAAGQEEMVREAIKAGAKGFIVKPFNEEKVIVIAKRILGM